MMLGSYTNPLENLCDKSLRFQSLITPFAATEIFYPIDLFVINMQVWLSAY